MIARLIRWSITNRFLVMLLTVIVSGWGVWAVLRAPLDALPDLSDVQVIIRTTYPGQAPRIVENQVTYPLTTTMLSVPSARVPTFRRPTICVADRPCSMRNAPSEVPKPPVSNAGPWVRTRIRTMRRCCRGQCILCSDRSTSSAGC